MNSPEAIWNWLLLPALCGLAVYGLCLAVGAVCAASVARHVRAALDVEQAQRREMPQSVADDLMDLADSLEQSPCDDPGSHSLTGCPRCIEVIVACCRFAFNESLANLWRKAEEQR